MVHSSQAVPNLPDKTPVPRSPAPQHDPVFIWPTPERQDLMFWVEKTGDLPKNKTWAYGDPYPDTATYPDHKLIHVEAQTPDKWSRWYYMSDRVNEDAYNWERGSDFWVRRYVVLRSAFTPKPKTDVGSADPASFIPATFVFSGETVNRLPEQLDSLYIMVEHRYSVAQVVSYSFDDNLQRTIKTTRTIIEAGSETGGIADGVVTEIEPQDTYFDYRVTREIVWTAADLDGGSEPVFPIKISSFAKDMNYSFPPLLRRVEILYTVAWAESENNAPAWASDWLVHYDMVDPANGPYRAAVIRFLTDDPAAVEAAYKPVRILTRREVIGHGDALAISNAWGNQASAHVRQIEVPPSIHDDLEIINADIFQHVVIEGGGGYSTSLAATPGFNEVVGADEMIVSCNTQRGPFGLFYVDVTVINTAGLYENRFIGDDGAVYTDPLPNTGVTLGTPTGAFNSDGSVFNGATTSGALVTMTLNGATYATATADTNGQFSMTLSPRLGQGETVTLIASFRGQVSEAFTATAPSAGAAKPIAWMPAAMNQVSGYTTAGATVHVLTAGNKQTIVCDFSGINIASLEAGDLDSVFLTTKIDGGSLAFTTALDGLEADINAIVTKIKAAFDAQTVQVSSVLTDITDLYTATVVSETLTIEYDVAESDHLFSLTTTDGADTTGITDLATADSTSGEVGDPPNSYTTIAAEDTTFTIPGIAEVVEGDEITVYAVDSIGTSENLSIRATATPPATPTVVTVNASGTSVDVTSAAGTVTVFASLAQIGTGASGSPATIALDPTQSNGETVMAQLSSTGAYSAVATDTAPVVTPANGPENIIQIGDIANNYLPAFAGTFDKDATYAWAFDGGAYTTSLQIALPDISTPYDNLLTISSSIFYDTPVADTARFLIQPSSAGDLYYSGEQIRLRVKYDDGVGGIIYSDPVYFRFPTLSLAQPSIKLLPRPNGLESTVDPSDYGSGGTRFGLWGSFAPGPGEYSWSAPSSYTGTTTVPSNDMRWRVDVSVPVGMTQDLNALVTAGTFRNRLRVSYPASNRADEYIELTRASLSDFRSFYAILHDDGVWKWPTTSPLAAGACPAVIEVYHEWGKTSDLLVSRVARWVASNDLNAYNMSYV